MNSRFILLLILLFPIIGYSQESDTIVNNYDMVQNIDPYFTYGKGLGITTPDSSYQLNFQMRMQNRVQMNFDENFNQESLQAMVKRLRLKLYGYVYDPRFVYYVQLSFSGGDVGDKLNPHIPSNIIRDAVFFYHGDNGLTFGFGQTKLPGNRQRINSSGDLQLADRSIVNAVFNIDRDFGIFANYHGSISSISYNIKTTISSGEGRNWLYSTGSGYMYSTRLEFFPLGDFVKNGAFFEGDLMREAKPKLMIAAAMYYNDKAVRANGTKGDVLYESNNIYGLFFDVIFKYRGFALEADYANRATEYNAININPDDPTEFLYTYNGYGINTQASYIFENDFEFVARFSQVTPESSIQSLESKTTQYTFGVNKYLKGHRFKLQLDSSYQIEENLSTSNSDNQWIFRAQVEIGF